MALIRGSAARRFTYGELWRSNMGYPDRQSQKWLVLAIARFDPFEAIFWDNLLYGIFYYISIQYISVGHCWGYFARNQYSMGFDTHRGGH